MYDYSLTYTHGIYIPQMYTYIHTYIPMQKIQACVWLLHGC